MGYSVHQCATISYLTLACLNVAYNQELVIDMANFTRDIHKKKIGMTLMALPDWIAHLIMKRCLSVESQLDLIIDLIVPEMEKIRSSKVSLDREPTYVSMVINLSRADGQSRTPKEAAF